MTDEICFYRSSEKPYGAFSNLYRREIVFEGEAFPTSEHAYQAGKARKPEVREWLMSAPSPALLAMAAHGLYYWDVAPRLAARRLSRHAAMENGPLLQIEEFAVHGLPPFTARMRRRREAVITKQYLIPRPCSRSAVK